MSFCLAKLQSSLINVLGDNHKTHRLGLVATPALLVSFFFWDYYGNSFLVHSARQEARRLAIEDGEADAVEQFHSSNYYAQGLSIFALAFNNLQQARQLFANNFSAVFATATITAFKEPELAFVLSLLYGYSSNAFIRRLGNMQDPATANRTAQLNTVLFKFAFNLSIASLTASSLWSMGWFLLEGL